MILLSGVYTGFYVYDLDGDGHRMAVTGSIGDVDAAGDIQPGEATSAGREIQAAGVTDSSEIVFVGNWGQDSGLKYFGKPTPPYFRLPVLSRALIYSDVLVREHAVNESNDAGPRFAQSIDEVDDCSVAVVRENQWITVSECDSV